MLDDLNDAMGIPIARFDRAIFAWQIVFRACLLDFYVPINLMVYGWQLDVRLDI
jgi:hypothetical protein